MASDYLTMSDLAKLYHVHPRTARRWAAADHWQRTTTRPVRYSVDDADKSWRKRHSDRITAGLAQRHATMELKGSPP